MIEKYQDEIPPSLKGYFIISESNMQDPNFYQTVVLILEHNEEGAFGLVVNRRSNLTLGDIIPRFSDLRGHSTPVYVGGPVQQEFLFVLHSPAPAPSSEAAIRPVEGVIFEPSFQHIESYFDDTFPEEIEDRARPHIHLFLGYSGWAPGQLEREMELGSWMILPATPKLVFHENPEQGWKDALREKGGIYRVFADLDPNPNLN